MTAEVLSINKDQRSDIMKSCPKFLPTVFSKHFPDSTVCAKCFQYAVVEQMDKEKSIYVTYSVNPYRTFSNKNSVKLLHVVDCTKSDEFRNVWIKVQKTALANSNAASDLVSADCKNNKQSVLKDDYLIQDDFKRGNSVSNILGQDALESAEKVDLSAGISKNVSNKFSDIKIPENIKVSRCSVKLIKSETAEIASYLSSFKNKIEKTDIPVTSPSTLSEHDIKAAILSSSVSVVLNRNLEEIIASSSRKHKKASDCDKSKKRVKGCKSKDEQNSIKGTLKRKRLTEDSKENDDESYEDDIFENQNIRLPDFFDDESDSEDSIEDMETPKFEYSVSPEEKSSSPVYEDCYSPGELDTIRKEAEQYNSRRKRRKLQFSTEQNPSFQENANKQLNVDDALSEVCRILSEKKLEEKDSDEEKEDCYFSDSSDNI